MITLGLLLAAWAEEPWSTGITRRAPVSPAVQLSWRNAIGAAWFQEFELEGGGLFVRTRNGGLGFGGSARVGGHVVFAFDEPRTGANIGSLGGSLWLIGWGPRRRSWHGTGVEVAGSPT